ncbi:MAG: NosD domain-containing protein, partial [Candidatus Izemoplasmatales bacterium]|nr:NosD domain-containing protein [Candidatus Izemoplasmatales bacterium]
MSMCKFFLTSLLLSIMVICATANAAEIYVPVEEPTIQAAVNNASAGDIIIVKPGTYYENVDVNKTQLTIISESSTPENTKIIALNPQIHVFEITADSVVISGFNISVPNDETYSYCIYLNDVNSCSIYNNKLMDTSYYGYHNYGIFLDSSSYNIINNNTFLTNHCSVYLNSSSDYNIIYNNDFSQSSGITIKNSNNSMIYNNTFKNNIVLTYSVNNSIYSNIIQGTSLTYSNYNSICNNTAVDSSKIMFEFNLLHSNNNTIQNNSVGDGKLSYSYDNKILDNIISKGVILEYSNDNILKGNNIEQGVKFSDSNKNNFSNNLVWGCDYNGMYLYNSSNNNISKNLVSSNEENGILLESKSNYNVLLNNVVSRNFKDGIYLSESSYNVLKDNSASNNDDAIQLFDSSYNILNNNTVSNNDDGIGLSGGSYNVLDNNTALNNDDYGIHLYKSNDSILSNNIATSDYWCGICGIQIGTTTNNTLKNNTASFNRWMGIWCSNSDNCTIINNNALNNGDYGLALTHSKNNTVKNNKFSDNEYGFILSTSSINNKIYENIVTSNMKGVWICNSGNNSLFDNYFNNTNNTEFDETSLETSLNSWNTTKIKGENIVLGPYFAGNYWATPEGTGFSQTHEDKDGDGICDEIYTLSEGNIDYLPLALPPEIQTPVLPFSDFTANVTRGYAPLAVEFTDLSKNASEWAWDFNNDGEIDLREQNCTYIYRESENYTVNLTVSNANGSDSETKVRYITVLEPQPLIYPIANFSANITSGINSLDVQFEDLSSNAMSWEWDVNGDYKVDYTTQNPVHTYDTPGIYNVSLTVTNANGSDFKSRIGYITVLEPVFPFANFSTNITEGYVPLTVKFTDLSQNASEWEWDFGDGNTITEENPTHTYTAVGSYTVKLTVSNTNGTSTKNDIIIEVMGAQQPIYPVANFSADHYTGISPLVVHFTDTSTGNVINRAWDFNNDSIIDSTEISPIYEFQTGNYTVNLTVSNENGSDFKTAEICVKSDSVTDDTNDNQGGNRGSSSGGSGGGGGGGSPEPASNVEVKELSQQFISNGKHVKFIFSRNVTCIAYLEFDPQRSFGKTTTIVEMLKNQSVLVDTLPEGVVYKSVNIWVGNGGVGSSENVDNAVICFKVEKKWMEENEVDA